MGVCTLLAKTRARNGEVCVQVCGVCVGMNRGVRVQTYTLFAEYP